MVPLKVCTVSANSCDVWLYLCLQLQMGWDFLRVTFHPKTVDDTCIYGNDQASDAKVGECIPLLVCFGMWQLWLPAATVRLVQGVWSGDQSLKYMSVRVLCL